MLQLDQALLVGKGLHRECFEHPENPSLCVKIEVAGQSNENRREAKYYRMLQRRGISWEMLARFHGFVETNRGEGAVFELVRDFDGEVSATLAHYLQSGELFAAYGEQLAAALPALKAYLLRDRIITMTLKAKNMAFQRIAQGQGRLVLVDNVGNSDFIPASNYSAWLARRKIERKWARFEQLLASQYSPRISGRFGAR
jgi:hypothetical protein